jgi:hypothetical protein
MYANFLGLSPINQYIYQSGTTERILPVGDVDMLNACVRTPLATGPAHTHTHLDSKEAASSPSYRRRDETNELSKGTPSY